MNKKEHYKLTFRMAGTIFFPFYTQDLALTSREFSNLFKTKILSTTIHEHDSTIDMYFPKEEWDSASKYLIDSFQNKKYFNEMKRKIAKSYNEINTLINHLNSLKNIDIKDIIREYQQFIDVLTNFRVYAIIPNLMSLGNITLIEQYRSILSKSITNKDFSVLTTPNNLSESTLAEKDLLLLKENISEIKKWIDKWGYIYYYYVGPLPTINTVQEMIQNTRTNTPNIKKRLEEIKKYSHNIQKEKRKIIKDLNLSKKDVHLLNVLAFFGNYKLERKELMQKSYVAFDKIFKELSKLTKININDLKHLTIKETEDILLKKIDFFKIIKNRKKGFMFTVKNKNIKIYTDKKEIKKILDAWKIYVPSQKLTVAYVGPTVKGKMIIIDTKQDMKKINNLKGRFILASSSTYPYLVPVMKKSAGIVTKVGGLTSHAAIVSRELKTPCIVGYKNLFEDFNEGDIIELNTKKGIVRKIK